MNAISREDKMSINVKNNVFWVGKIDWELRKFHGDEYSTHRGSTYNSYLIKEEKTAASHSLNKVQFSGFGLQK